jgi:tripartite-type tricarboxylate transporter receptor subunit TctC
VTRLNAEANKVLRTAEVRARLAADGADPAGGTPQELAAYHKADYEKWGKVVKAAGVKGE